MSLLKIPRKSFFLLSCLMLMSLSKHAQEAPPEYRCLDGYQRSAAFITADNACVQYATAKQDGVFGCENKYGAGAIPTNGKCYKCPDGYSRTLEPIGHERACAKTVVGPYKKAISLGSEKCDEGTEIIGGECWVCPSGYRPSGFPIAGPKACEKVAKAILPQDDILRQYKMRNSEQLVSDMSDKYEADIIKVLQHLKGLSKRDLQNFAKAQKAGSTTNMVTSVKAGELSKKIGGEGTLANSASNNSDCSSLSGPKKGNSTLLNAQFYSMTLGLSLDGGLALVSPSVEGGISFNLCDEKGSLARGYVAAAYGISAGESVGLDGALVVGVWTNTNDNIAGDSYGFLGGAAYVGGAAIGFWFSYDNYINGEPEFLGFTVALQVGVSIEAEYVRATMAVAGT